MLVLSLVVAVAVFGAVGVFVGAGVAAAVVSLPACTVFVLYYCLFMFFHSSPSSSTRADTASEVAPVESPARTTCLF